MASLTLRSLYPRERVPDTQYIYTAGLAPEPVWMAGEEKISASEQGSNIDALVVMWDILKYTTYFLNTRE